jgi:hypothetical protein
LTQYGYISIDKTHKILHNLLGVPISVGTIKNIQREFASKAGEPIKETKRNLFEPPVLNVDETGGGQPDGRNGSMWHQIQGSQGGKTALRLKIF